MNFELNKKPIMYVDATPDIEYPLRILKAYRKDCNCKYTDNTAGEEPKNSFLNEMNKLNDERAKVLDIAIQILEKQLKTVSY